MKFAFIMDPLHKVKPEKDTTYFIMLAAQERGHEVFYLDQFDLIRDHDGVFAETTAVQVHADPQRPFTIGEPKIRNMGEMDGVMIRTDPPFDRNYFYTTLMMDLLPPSVAVVNEPAGLRNWNEKLAAMLFPEFTPETLITRRADHVRGSVERFGRVVLKPIDGFAGKGIFFLSADDPNFDNIVDAATHGGRHRILVQRYEPTASEGDKRILLLDGEPMGAILRVHEDGKELNNLDAGGSAHPVELTERDLEICAAIKPGLISEKLFFTGIDIIGGQLIEINVTSPTGLRQLCDFSGVPYNHHIIQAWETKVKAAQETSA